MQTKFSYPKVLKVKPLENYELQMVFEDGNRRACFMRKYFFRLIREEFDRLAFALK